MPIARLAPLLPLRSERIADEVLQGVPMRGGLNVESRDGEWWGRKGEELIVRRLASANWHVMFTAGAKAVIVNQHWALQLEATGIDRVTQLYALASTENVDFTNGQDTATSTNTRNVGELILASASGFTASVYRVAGVAGTTVTLDRDYEGATATVSSRFVPNLAKDASGTDVPYLATLDPRMSTVVFEQLVPHSAADSHAASPATIQNRQYLVVCSDRGVPVAIDLNDASLAVLRLWFYNTALSTPAAIPTAGGFGPYVATYAGRLFIAGAPDANGRFAKRTFWYSRFGDLLYWHSGIAGQTATGNYTTVDGAQDDFTALAPLGNDLIGHRQRSQTVITATGSTPPIATRTLRQGIGTYGRFPLCLVEALGVHFIWTELGPAIFDGSRVELIAREAYRALVGYGAVRVGSGAAAADQMPIIAVDATYLGRIYWRLGGSSAVFVYDYRAGAAWFETRVSLVGGGTITERENDSSSDRATYFTRSDGTIVRLAGGTTGLDPGLNDANGDAVPDCTADTGWMDFGYLPHKRLSKVEVMLRALDVGLNNYDEIDDVATPTEEIWLRLRVYADWDATTVRADVGATYVEGDTFALDPVEPDIQNPIFVLVFTPSVGARVFKFRFTNGLTAAATTAGYKKAQFRISQILAHYEEQESDQVRTHLTANSISE